MSAPPAPAGGLGDAVLAVIGGHGDCLVVAAPDDPELAAVRERFAERFVPVAGGGVRAAVAAGIALAGRRAVVLAGGDVPALLPLGLLPAGGAIAAVTGEATVAGAFWGAGWTLVQPAWPADVPALLAQALDTGGPVVVRVPEARAAVASAMAQRPPDAGAQHPRLGVPRVLREGTAGLLAASGARSTRLLVEVARMLAGRGVAVQALELHTAAPGEGPAPAAGDRALLVGERAVDAGVHEQGRWPPGLRVVPVPDDPRGAMEAVAARLRARR